MPQENRRQAEEKDREELMQRVTTDDEFRLLVNQYDAEAGAKSTYTRGKKCCNLSKRKLVYIFFLCFFELTFHD